MAATGFPNLLELFDRSTPFVGTPSFTVFRWFFEFEGCLVIMMMKGACVNFRMFDVSLGVFKVRTGWIEVN